MGAERKERGQDSKNEPGMTLGRICRLGLPGGSAFIGKAGYCSGWRACFRVSPLGSYPVIPGSSAEASQPRQSV